MQYDYPAAGSNGRQISQAVDRVAGESILYQYDVLKRVSSASASVIPAAQNQSFEKYSQSGWTTNGSQPGLYDVTDSYQHNGTYSLRLLTAAGGAYGGSAQQVISCSATQITRCLVG